MTREEAIKILSSGGWWDLLDPDGSDADLNPLDDAIDMALTALRAKQMPVKLDRSRWKGCDWCNGRYCDNCFWQLKMKDTARCKRCVDKSEWTPIVSYCSNCGKPQTEQAWAEMERGINSGTID